MKALHLLNLAVFFRTQIFMLPVLLLFYQLHGLSVTDFFFFQGLFSLTALLFEIPAGYISDKYPRKIVLIFAHTLYLTRLILFLYVPSYIGILLGELVFGISKAFITGTSDSYIYDVLSQKGKSHQMLKNYGSFNFCISLGASIATLTGAWIYQQQGFLFILSLEIFLNTLSISLLFLLPNIPATKMITSSFYNKYKIVFKTVSDTLKNRRLNVFIIFSSLLTGITTVFVWSFQPLMKLFEFPILFFGVIYFINHLIRAIASSTSSLLLKKMPLSLFAILSYSLYLISFIVIDITLFKPEFIIGFIILTLMCFAIGSQLVFSIGNTVRLHRLASQTLRATVSSTNIMISRLFSAILLISLKFFPNKSILTPDTFQIMFFVLGTFFAVLGAFLLKKMFQKQISFKKVTKKIHIFFIDFFS